MAAREAAAVCSHQKWCQHLVPDVKGKCSEEFSKWSFARGALNLHIICNQCQPTTLELRQKPDDSFMPMLEHVLSNADTGIEAINVKSASGRLAPFISRADKLNVVPAMCLVQSINELGY